MDAVDFFIVTICACAIYVIMDLLKAQRRSVEVLSSEAMMIVFQTVH